MARTERGGNWNEREIQVRSDGEMSYPGKPGTKVRGVARPSRVVVCNVSDRPTHYWETGARLTTPLSSLLLFFITLTPIVV